jgi:hypothetical protein
LIPGSAAGAAALKFSENSFTTAIQKTIDFLVGSILVVKNLENRESLSYTFSDRAISTNIPETTKRVG